MSSCLTNILSLLSQADLYYSHVSLYHNGRKRITSKLGLVMTWVALLLMLSYSAYRGTVLVTGAEFQTQMANILNPLNYSQTQVKQMDQFGFDIAVDFNGPYPKEYGEFKFSLYQHTWQDGDYSTLKRVYTDIELEPCTPSNFNHSDKEEMRSKGMFVSYYCVKNKSQLAMGGTFMSDFFQQLDLTVTPCVNGSDLNYTCKSEEEIYHYFSKKSLSLLVSNYYFDKDDKEEPIKSYLDDAIYFTFQSQLQQTCQIFLQVAEAKFYDSFMPWAQAVIRKFTILERVSNHIASTEWVTPRIVNVQIREDQWSKNYLKEVFTLTDFFSEIGGMFNSIYGFGKLIVFLFAESLFLLNLISNFYVVNQGSFPKLYQASSRNQSEQICQEIAQRKQLSLNVGEFILSQIPCRRKQKQQLQNSKADKIQLFKKGKQLLKADLDVVKLLKVLREFKIMKKLLFTKEELMLIGQSRECVLENELDGGNCQQNDVMGNPNCESNINPLTATNVLYRKLETIEKAVNECKKSSISKALIQGILEKDMKYRERSLFDNQVQKHSQSKGPKNSSPKVAKVIRRKRLTAERGPENNLSSNCQSDHSRSRLEEMNSASRLQQHVLDVKYRRRERQRNQ